MNYKVALFFRDHSRYGLSQWETTLQCNVVSLAEPIPRMILGFFCKDTSYKFPCGLVSHNGNRLLLHWATSKPDHWPAALTRRLLPQNSTVPGLLTILYSAVPSIFHDDIIKWKRFPRYLPFVWGIYRSPVNSPHNDQWHRALMFSSIRAWTNGWVNNREAGDLRRNRAHYDVTAMSNIFS